MADHDQWVNLEKDPKFVEDEVKALARAGALHVEVQMRKGTKPNLLKVRLTPVSEPNTHTPTERGRNPRFTLLRTRKVAVVSKKKFKVEEDIELPAAGGNKYKVEGKVKKKVVESAKHVISWRKIYYQAVHMAGVSVPSLASMETDYEAHFIKLKMKDAARSVPFLTNTDSTTSVGRNHVVRTAASGYTMDRYEPYTVCVFFVNMIAKPEENFVLDPTTSPVCTLGAGIFSWSGEDISFKLPEDKYLWWGLNTIDDAQNGGRGNWLTPGSVYFQGDDGVPHRIPDGDVRVDTSKRVSALGGYNTLKIRLPWSARNFWSSNTIRFGMVLKVVKGFSGGYSEPEVNLITVASSGWWQPCTDAERLQVLNHEMGHKLGMLPDGTGKRLDRPASFYTGQGHQGPHCASSAVYTSGASNPWQGTPACVMFGATSCYDSAVGHDRPAPSTYCPDCEKLVKKLDLYGSDLPGLSNSVRRGHI
jgi:type VI secretion system secreted protein VgrG